MVGSSNKIISGFEYNNLRKAILDFCPPDNFVSGKSSRGSSNFIPEISFNNSSSAWYGL